MIEILQKAAAQNGLVKFGIGAIAATPFNPSLVSSLATGATSATLTILHDIWKGRMLPPKRALMNHFVVMTASPP